MPMPTNRGGGGGEGGPKRSCAPWKTAGLRLRLGRRVDCVGEGEVRTDTGPRVYIISGARRCVDSTLLERETKSWFCLWRMWVLRCAKLTIFQTIDPIGGV